MFIRILIIFILLFNLVFANNNKTIIINEIDKNTVPSACAGFIEYYYEMIDNIKIINQDFMEDDRYYYINGNYGIIENNNIKIIKASCKIDRYYIKDKGTLIFLSTPKTGNIFFWIK